MLSLAAIIFWATVGLMFHSYILYPRLLRWLANGKVENQIIFDSGDELLPDVFVIFSAFNEEKVIREKLESIFLSTYPSEKLHVYVGSDNSTDQTNEIVEGFTHRFSNLTFIPFAERNGKSNVLNSLVKMVQDKGVNPEKDIFILTDANVIFAPETIYELSKHFKNNSIAQVGANILNKGVIEDGISFQEKTYIQNENNIKYYEGLNWGCMIGAFGGCYALRAGSWKNIPQNQLMEDFYLSMNVLHQGQKAIHEKNALCYEDVSSEVGEEFKRKTRIQAGNFQNLAAYWKLLLRFNPVAFCFLSHKVIRWVGPLLILLAYLSNIFLISQSPFYLFTFILQNLLLQSPLVDYLLKTIGIHLIVLRFASYFYLMNLALLMGFILYMRGIKTNSWNPTKRNL
ncbi:MAG: glycosyltransferase [Bacteroidetes bacterium]|nr:glycosyltransferase [Bacteroidota bacterium]